RLASHAQAVAEQARRRAHTRRRRTRSGLLRRDGAAHADAARMSVRLAVFDCDGTLSDGQAAVCAALTAAFAETGLPPPALPEVRRGGGLGLPSAIARRAPGAASGRQQHAVEAYAQALRSARLDGMLLERLYDGIPSVLAP